MPIFLAATSVGMALLWRAMSGDDGRRRVGAIATAGVAFGVAILFKLVAGADLVAAICMLLI